MIRVELNNIANLIELQGAKITKIDCVAETEITVWAEPINKVQNCPCCGSEEVIRNGKDGYRKIRHLPISDKKCLLVIPQIRMYCKNCSATYGWKYEFVEGKQQYSKAFKASIYKNSIGSTVKNAVECVSAPYSTIERFFKEIVMKLAPLTEKYVMKTAQDATKLILGIDDFAIRKGHNYNTGIHDLRGETFLGIIKGRKISELKEYANNNPEFVGISPYAVVMDLAKCYHSFVAELFPTAIRIADRFHVNGYIIEALNDVRRRISKELAPQAKLALKQYKHILNKRNDQLSSNEKKQLDMLLSYSKELRDVYEHKEKLAEWYDCSPNYKSALKGFTSWINYGHSLNIPEVEIALKTFENWQTEIVNYHRCCFTNGIVEGRNGKIKSLQRRRFFLQNREYYVSLIMLECNNEISRRLFNLHYV